jgi:hypothetical protein
VRARSERNRKVLTGLGRRNDILREVHSGIVRLRWELEWRRKTVGAITNLRGRQFKPFEYSTTKTLPMSGPFWQAR